MVFKQTLAAQHTSVVLYAMLNVKCLLYRTYSQLHVYETAAPIKPM